MEPRDTDPAAHEVHMRWYRRLSSEERVALAADMSEEVREVARAGIEARHPEYSPAEVRFALLRLILGASLFRRAWPHAPTLAP